MRKPVVSVDTPVAEERPYCSRHSDLIEVEFDNHNLFLGNSGFGQQLATGITGETLPPKFDTRVNDGLFCPNTIYGRNITTIRDRMRTLDRFPTVKLCVSLCRFFLR